MQLVTVVGIHDKINDMLGSYCADGYGAGSTGAANIKWLEQQNFEFIRIERVYRMGNLARFEGTVSDSAQFGRFLEALKGLESYPLFDEEILSDMQQEWTDESWAELQAEYGLDTKIMWDVISGGDYYWEDDGHADNYGMHAAFDIEEFVQLVKTQSQTWLTHYYAQMLHETEVCQYCKDAKMGA